MHISTRGRDRSHNSKGRVIHLVECMHLGDCICSGGVASEFFFARCVEPLPLLEGLAVFRHFKALLVVLSPLPLLEG